MNEQRKNFWKDKRILITGNTGFKGSWMSLWLNKLGAKVYGYALPPNTIPSLYTLADIDNDINTEYNDIRHFEKLKNYMHEIKPEIIFHMAAQSLVRKSYFISLTTYETNIMGTVNVFEAARSVESIREIINITSDKCYEDKQLERGYNEEDALGGFDPYSCSKSCSELITTSFRNSFFTPEFDLKNGVGIASARSGNVIAGGDWSADRLVPDIILSILNNKSPLIRNPDAVRPWQYVLDSLNGYMILAENLWSDSKKFNGAWNFGPCCSTDITVAELTDNILKCWNNDKKTWVYDRRKKPYENVYLRLDSTKARSNLNWQSKLDTPDGIKWTVDWYKAYQNNENMKNYTINQINQFEQI